VALSNAERQQKFRQRRHDLAALVDLKGRYALPGTSAHAKLTLAFLLALVRHGTISESADDDGLTLQLHADRANLPDEARMALRRLRDYVCPPLGDDEYFNMNEGSVDVHVRIAPLIERKTKKPKVAVKSKAKPKAGAARRKR
jgi:hypothetical protein